MFIIDRNVVNTYNHLNGTFCLSNAATYHNIGTILPKVIQLLTNNPSARDTNYIRYYYTDDLTNNLIKLPTGNFVTNLDRTILEEMNYNPIDEFVSQEMEDYNIEGKLDYLKEFNNRWHYCSEENFNLALECYYEWLAGY